MKIRIIPTLCAYICVMSILFYISAPVLAVIPASALLGLFLLTYVAYYATDRLIREIKNIYVAKRQLLDNQIINDNELNNSNQEEK